jgi:hypothetical protein
LLRGIDLSSIEAWLKEFLSEFRKQCGHLSEDEKSRISNLDNFLPPCQMLFLHFKDANFQFLIVTHDEKRKDSEITVQEAIPTCEAVDTLENILKDQKWDRELSDEEKRFVVDRTVRFSDILKDVFLGIVNQLKDLPFAKPGPTTVGHKSWLTATSFFWNIRGNIADLDHVEIASKIINEARKQAEAAKTEAKRPPPAPEKPSIRGSGTYLYPPIWIGQLPGQSFREQALGAFIFPQKAFDLKYKGKILVVNEDGGIAISEPDVAKATRMFNEIMATGLLLDLPFLAARELEVSDAQIDPSDFTTVSFGIRTISLRTQLFCQFAFIRSPSFIERREISKDKLVQLIQQAERNTQDYDIADFLVFLLEAYTYLQSSEYMQSFVMSWVIIERQMFWLWKKFLREEQIGRIRREKMMNPAYWTLDFVLQTLNLVGKISREDYQMSMDLKNKRNDIMHLGERVSESEAKKCFEIAKMIVQRRIG